MSRRFLPTNLWLWLGFHLAIPLLLFISVFCARPLRINTSLFDMLPRPAQTKAVMQADAILAEKNGRELIILAAAPDFAQAKDTAELLYAQCAPSPYIEKISLYIDSSIMADMYRYLYDYRFMIASGDTLALLENGEAQEIAEDALATAYGVFNVFSLENLASDPFLLTERRMGDFLASSLLSVGTMTTKEDVLAVEKDGTWYVLLRLTLAPGAVSVQAGNNVIRNIYTAASGREVYFSGVPFHSYESSSGAQREISLISTITLILILLLFLYTFRSPLPVLCSIAAVGISLGMGTAAALLVFREIHIITFVFGTTLIGTCIDYSVHFFVHWKGNPALDSGVMIRRHIAKSITMSFISTEICFLVFIFAPFPLLKQFAVFSMAGLLSSFLTFFCIYPRFKIPLRKENHRETRRKNNDFRFKNSVFLRGLLFFVLIVTILLLLIINRSSIKIENNLSSLYTMSASLLESEKRVAQVLDYGSPGWYFIVAGKDTEETLQHEENLIRRLEAEKERGNLASYVATSLFVPSIQSQHRTYKAMKALLPLAPEQCANLGFSAQYAQDFARAFAASASHYCLPVNAPAFAGIANLWIGEQNDGCYSCVMPIKPSDEAVFRSIAQEFDYVHFINKQKDISRDLDTLTKTMLLFFLAAFTIVAIIIFLVYKWPDNIKICTVPLIMILSAVAVLSSQKISLGFFSIAAIILVFGLGLDYIFYMIDRNNDRKDISLWGVTLSFATTLLSFGALALSSFMPVHIFGLTVSAGLVAAFISAIFLHVKDD